MSEPVVTVSSSKMTYQLLDEIERRDQVRIKDGIDAVLVYQHVWKKFSEGLLQLNPLITQEAIAKDFLGRIGIASMDTEVIICQAMHEMIVWGIDLGHMEKRVHFVTKSLV